MKRRARTADCLRVLEFLLQSGAFVDCRFDGYTNTTLLMMAAGLAEIEKALLLLQYGADKDLRDTKGQRAIDYIDSYAPTMHAEKRAEFVEMRELLTDPARYRACRQVALAGTDLRVLLNPDTRDTDAAADRRRAAEEAAESRRAVAVVEAAEEEARRREQRRRQEQEQQQQEQQRLRRYERERQQQQRQHREQRYHAAEAAEIRRVVAVAEVAEQQQQPPRQQQQQQQEQEQEAAAVTAVHALQHQGANGEATNIPFAVLVQWTENFDAARAIGSGGFGDVFRGEYTADSARRQYGAVAVKRANQALFGAGSEFQQQSQQDGAMASMHREIRTLRSFKHPNIIKLLGYHMPEGARPDLSRLCLVYELASNGGLDGWLRDDAKATRLDWRQRVNIAFGIATALNYLHCHRTGNPAYHRDVKSANIGLTVDFVPKLLDCGLAKFIPAGNTGKQTVFTRSGVAFGTPGYMCSQYVNTCVYDAKGDVFAFGIVLAELYGGKLQNTDGLLINDEAIEDGVVVPDARLAIPPKAFIDAWKELCFNCTKSYKKRVATMMTVVRELGNLKQAFSNVARADNLNELNHLRRAMEEVQLKETVDQRLQREESLRSKRQCLACIDEFTLSTGVECANGHFMCDECFRGDNLTSQLSVENYWRFRGHGSRLVCQGCTSDEPHAFEDSEIASHLGPDGFASYRFFCEDVVRAEASKVAKARASNAQLMAQAAVAELAGKQLRVFQHRRHINEHILTVVVECPRAGCNWAFVDWEACFAVKCMACGCGFCGWCLQDNGQSNGCGDANHQHVRQCPTAPSNRRGGTNGDMSEFHEIQARRRGRDVEHYIGSAVDVEDRDDVWRAIAGDIRTFGTNVDFEGRQAGRLQR